MYEPCNHDSYLSSLREDIAAEMDRAGFTDPGLIKAANDFFDRELREHGPAPTTLFFIMFLARLCSTRLRACVRQTVTVRADVPQGVPVPITDDEAQWWRESSRSCSNWNRRVAEREPYDPSFSTIQGEHIP